MHVLCHSGLQGLVCAKILCFQNLHIIFGLTRIFEDYSMKSKDPRVSPDDLRDSQLRLIAGTCNWLIGYYFLFPNRPLNSPTAGAMGV
jgi:hypothetical protein